MGPVNYAFGTSPRSEPVPVSTPTQERSLLFSPAQLFNAIQHAPDRTPEGDRTWLTRTPASSNSLFDRATPIAQITPSPSSLQRDKRVTDLKESRKRLDFGSSTPDNAPKQEDNETTEGPLDGEQVLPKRLKKAFFTASPPRHQFSTAQSASVSSSFAFLAESSPGRFCSSNDAPDSPETNPKYRVTKRRASELDGGSPNSPRAVSFKFPSLSSCSSSSSSLSSSSCSCSSSSSSSSSCSSSRSSSSSSSSSSVSSASPSVALPYSPGPGAPSLSYLFLLDLEEESD